MRFDNGLFAFEPPPGWSAAEGDDGNVYVTASTHPEIWVSIEVLGVDGAGKPVDATTFVRKTYQDKLRLPTSLESHGQDGRYIIRWKEVRQHEGSQYAVSHGLVAWNQSPMNLQMLMFQSACPLQLQGAPAALEAEAIAWSAPAELELHAWRT